MSYHCFLSGNLRLYYALIGYLHWFLRLFVGWQIPKPKKRPPKKILLANCGALGDLVLSTGVIAEIKSTFPDCQIGVAVSNESKQVFKTSPFIDWIHVVQSPDTQRGKTKWQQLVALFRFSWIEAPRAAKEIAAIGYDAAIELRPFFPNLIPIFWKARIPLRIGFMTSGNSSLLNAPTNWQGGQYLPHCYWPLLAKIGIEQKGTKTLMPHMVLKNPAPLLVQKPYLLFHLCSSDSVKELPNRFWKTIYLKCKEWGWNIYFTGKGKRERQIIEQVSNDRKENLCDHLDWDQFVQHIKECDGLVSIDSVPIHLAACFGVPTTALFRETSWPILWAPQVPTTTTLGLETPIQTEDVLQVIESWRRR